MRTKVRTWTRFFLLLAMIAAAAVAWVCTGPVPASADVEDTSAVASVGVRLKLDPGYEIDENTSYAQLKNALTVEAFGADGTSLGELGTSQFELEANFAEGSNETNEFTVVVSGSDVQSKPFKITGFTAQKDAVRSISATYNGGATLYSYTPVVTIPSYFTVKAIGWDGTEKTLSQSEYTIQGNLAPKTPNVNAPYDVEVTVAYQEGGRVTNITCPCTVTGVNPATPVTIFAVGSSVNALASCAAGDLTVTVVYSGGTVTLSFGAYRVEYMRKTEEGGWEVDPDATGYIYEDGSGRVKITYTENGTSVECYADLQVSRVAVTAPNFSAEGSDYRYSVSDNIVTGTKQTIGLNSYYDPAIMEITGVSAQEGFSGTAPTYNASNGSITVTDAGTYTVTVALKESAQAYFFRNDENNEDLREVTVEYKIYPVEPPIGIEWSDGAYEGGELRWNRDDDVSFTLLNNYGGGYVTYTYGKTGGGTTSGTGEEPNLPNETGTYTLTVSVAARGNFTAVNKELATFTIGQRVLGAPTLSALTYTGVRQAPFVTYAGENDASYLSVTNAGGTNAGTYTATFEIDGTEAVWSEDIGGEGYEVEGSTLDLRAFLHRSRLYIQRQRADGRARRLGAFQRAFDRDARHADGLGRRVRRSCER